MKTTGNTVLITGGSAGIGFEIAKLLSEKGNKVIITGRNKQRLEAASKQLKNVTAIVSDVSKANDVDALVATITQDFPSLNIVINNAGKASVLNFTKAENFESAGEEIDTNYLSVLRLTEKLLPVLKQNEQAAIVNVSSIVAFVPSHRIATYAASKAALHSYTQSLRFVLSKDTQVKVFELMPPLVNTEFSQEIGGENGIPPSVVAEDLFNAIANDEYEIHVGGTADIYKLSLASPKDAYAAMNS